MQIKRLIVNDDNLEFGAYEELEKTAEKLGVTELRLDNCDLTAARLYKLSSAWARRKLKSVGISAFGYLLVLFNLLQFVLLYFLCGVNDVLRALV